MGSKRKTKSSSTKSRAQAAATPSPAFSSIDIEAVVSKHLSGSDIVPQEIRDENEILDQLASEILAPNSPMKSTATGFGLVSRARRVVTRLESLQQAVWKALEAEIEEARQRVQRFGALCGLASLPSTVLADIILLAIREDTDSEEPEKQSISAVHMSHVCRHFRDTVLSTPEMWTVICTTPHPTSAKLDLVHACLERSGDNPLDVHLNIYEPSEGSRYSPDAQLGCDEVFNIVQRHAHRWRSFNLKFIELPNTPPMLRRVGEETEDLGLFHSPNVGLVSAALQDMHDLSCPLLESIMLPFAQASVFIGKNMELCSSWDMPSLTTLSIMRCLPSTLPHLDRIVDFHFTLFCKHVVDDDVSSLVTLAEVLKQMTSLRVLVLNFLPAMPTDMALPAMEEINLDSVEKLTILLNPYCTVENSANFSYPYLRSFLSVLSFPNTSDLTIHLQDSTDESLIQNVVDLRTIFEDLFKGDRLPAVKSCMVMAFLLHSHWLHVKPGEHQTSLPKTFPASLENLTILCNTSLHLDILRSRFEEPCLLPNLQSVKLDVGQNRPIDMIAKNDWVRWLGKSCGLGSGMGGNFKGLRILERGMDGQRKGSQDGEFHSRMEMMMQSLATQLPPTRGIGF
ncbi:hypothetical protein SCHPADRAFT_1001701 [Schizopora paradoxa]|uniref:F-box domain-containing protein n=1 Tax=Schizopora paradoxa TaxID=27342 RepID=A0A0H2R6J7_9AGAM|nr:hypothetical protein SCHPADRAFT_1001701 [Schizopora paradoxa]